MPLIKQATTITAKNAANMPATAIPKNVNNAIILISFYYLVV